MSYIWYLTRANVQESWGSHAGAHSFLFFRIFLSKVTSCENPNQYYNSPRIHHNHHSNNHHSNNHHSNNHHSNRLYRKMISCLLLLLVLPTHNNTHGRYFPFHIQYYANSIKLLYSISIHVIFSFWLCAQKVMANLVSLYLKVASPIKFFRAAKIGFGHLH